MKPKSLFEFAKMHDLDGDLIAPARDRLPASSAQGGATEAANTQSVEQVMAEASLVLAGKKDFRGLLRALRG